MEGLRGKVRGGKRHLLTAMPNPLTLAVNSPWVQPSGGGTSEWGAGSPKRELMGRGRVRLSTFHNNDLQRKELTDVSRPHTLPVGTAPACQDPKSRKET